MRLPQPLPLAPGGAGAAAGAVVADGLAAGLANAVPGRRDFPGTHVPESDLALALPPPTGRAALVLDDIVENGRRIVVEHCESPLFNRKASEAANR